MAGDIVNIGRVNPHESPLRCKCSERFFKLSSQHEFHPNGNHKFPLYFECFWSYWSACRSGDLVRENVNTLAVGTGTLNAGSIVFSEGGNFGDNGLQFPSERPLSSGDVSQSGSSFASITFSGGGSLKLRGSFLNSGNATLRQAPAPWNTSVLRRLKTLETLRITISH